jgi:hypothetical protein
MANIEKYDQLIPSLLLFNLKIGTTKKMMCWIVMKRKIWMIIPTTR